MNQNNNELTPDKDETPKPQSSPQEASKDTPEVSPQEPETPPGPPPSTADSSKIVETPITRVSSPPGIKRRSFIKWLVLGWSAFAAVVAGYGALVMRFLFPNVLFEPKQSFNAGPPDDYQVGEVSQRWKEKQNVWIVRDSERIYALSTVCTHLGCTPNWLANEGKFKCPCHGSGFYKTGINFEGPAPRPLERFRINLSDNGDIIVDKTKKFQQEKGEWDDAESYIMV